MSQTLTPRPAATVLAVRDGSRGFEVLMLRRNLKSDFVGGAYVFPGGARDENDAYAQLQRRTFGLDERGASKILGVDSGGLAYFVAVLRELFEEAGLLIVCRGEGEIADLTAARMVARF